MLTGIGGLSAQYLHAVWRGSVASVGGELEKNIEHVYSTSRLAVSNKESELYGRVAGHFVRDVGKTKYKPVAKKILPVAVSVPSQNVKRKPYGPVNVPEGEPLSPHPPDWRTRARTKRTTDERVEILYGNIPSGFLKSQEEDLIMDIAWRCEEAIAWTDAERGTFRSDIFPDYEMETVPHEPWNLAAI